jgi:hypothetical protein
MFNLRVLARGSGGRWIKFSEEFRARAHLLKESHWTIVTTPQGFANAFGSDIHRTYEKLSEEERAAVDKYLPPIPPPKKSKAKKMKFETAPAAPPPLPTDILAAAMFEGLLEIAYDVYSIYARTKEEAIATGKRPPRKKDGVFYEVIYDAANAKHAAAFGELPRQAKLCLLTLQAKQKEGTTLDQPTAELIIEDLKFQLKTKQEPWRVFKFYQTKFVQLDLLRIRNGAA